MGRRPIDPAIQLSRTIGISVLISEHEAWLHLPMPERRRVSALLRQVLRHELGFGEVDMRQQLLRVAGVSARSTRRASSALASTTRSKASEPRAGEVPSASAAPATSPATSPRMAPSATPAAQGLATVPAQRPEPTPNPLREPGAPHAAATPAPTPTHLAGAAPDLPDPPDEPQLDTEGWL